MPIPTRMSFASHGVACDAVLEAAAALPPGPCKPGCKGDDGQDTNVVRSHGVACDAVLEAAAALPPGPSKPGCKGDDGQDTNVVRRKR